MHIHCCERSIIIKKLLLRYYSVHVHIEYKFTLYECIFLLKTLCNIGRIRSSPQVYLSVKGLNSSSFLQILIHVAWVCFQRTLIQSLMGTTPQNKSLTVSPDWLVHMWLFFQYASVFLLGKDSNKKNLHVQRSKTKKKSLYLISWNKEKHRFTMFECCLKWDGVVFGWGGR